MAASNKTGAPLAGLHVVIVPAWWPTPEQPSAGTFFRDYAREFAAAGARVGVVYPDLVSLRHVGRGFSAPVFPRVIDEQVDDAIHAVRVRGLHTALHVPAVQMHRFRRWLERGLEHYGERHGMPDVLQAMCAIPSAWACTRLRGPLARRVVATEVTGPFADLMRRRSQARFVHEGLQRAAAVTTPGERSRQEMAAEGIDRAIDVVAVPVARAFSETEISTSRHTPPQGLFVGRLVAEKGVRELMAACRTLHDRFDFHLHVAGDGPMREAMRVDARAGGLESRVSLHGFCKQAQVVQLMQECDFLVLPTHADTFGLAAAEALCMGLAVVTTHGTGCGDLLGPDDGVLTAIGDANSLADGLAKLLGSLDRYDRGALAARARERFGGDVCARQYASLYERVLGRQ